ncbi:MAG: 13E12 repeat family protein [Actinobacteria bacterium]|nr:13E12 repeat family protein [Actinomycetota bacterium]
MEQTRRYPSRRAEARSGGGARTEVGASVAREVRGGYDPGAGENETPAVRDVGEALGLITQGLDALAGLDLRDEIDRDVADAAIAAQRHVNRLQAQQTRLLERVRVTGVHRLDGAVSIASWYAAHTGLDGAATTRIARRAHRLDFFPQLQQAYQAGHISSDHVDPVVRATTSRRLRALQDAEDALVTFAKHGTPTDVRRAVKLIRDQVDPDGTDAQPLGSGLDERREFTVHPGIDGLGDVKATVVPDVHELLVQLLETLAVRDSKDVPKEQRRTAAQIRHDAFAEILRRAAAATLETRNGARPHVNLMIDLWTLLGQEAAAPSNPGCAVPAPSTTSSPATCSPGGVCTTRGSSPTSS